MNTLLEVRNLSKTYGDRQVVKKIKFQLNQGEILGFIGPNGAGKSTTVKMLVDIEAKDEGEIDFLGEDIQKDMADYKKAIGVVPQDIAVYDDLSAYDNVKFFCSLYGFSGKELKERTREALEFTGLWDRRRDYPTKYSGGMKRRLNIACSIAHSPKLLIMDEPTVGIDPQSRNHIMETIRTLNQRGTAVIYISHYMEEIEAICDRVLIMDHGTILEDMKTEQLIQKYSASGKNLASQDEVKGKYDNQPDNSLEKIFLSLTGTMLRDEEGG